MNNYTIGIDVGGTNIKLGLVSPKGKIISRSILKTKHFVQNKKKLIDALINEIHGVLKICELKRNNIRGIGLGLPGLINPQKGIVNFLPNVSGWKNVPLARMVRKATGIATFLDNDVNLITLAEWKFGAGKNCHNLVCITLGTGVGGGLVINNSLYRGEGFAAGEVGHLPLNEEGPRCNCGGMACFERYVGNKYLLIEARKIFKNKNIELEDIFSLAQQGNRRALAFWDRVAAHVGNALVGVVNLLNPSLIVIGGGVSSNFPFMKANIQRIISNRAMPVQSKMVKIVKAKLGNDAGIIGAQVLVQNVS